MTDSFFVHCISFARWVFHLKINYGKYHNWHIIANFNPLKFSGYFMYHHFIYHTGRTVEQAVSRLPVNAEALVRFRVSPYLFCGECCDLGHIGLIVIWDRLD